MNETEYRKSPWRFAFLALAVLSGGWLAVRQLMLWLAREMAFVTTGSGAASVGIIGGADGPTAVFVAAAPGFDWEIVIMTALLIVGIVGFLLLRKSKPKK